MRSNTELNLKVLWEIFISKWWIIVITAVVAFVSVAIFDKVTYVPKYSSTATMYILRQASEDSTIGEVSQSLNVATSIVKDCDYLIKSDSVIDIVKAELTLGEEYEDLSSMIKTSNPSGTRILEVRVEAGSPEMAKNIVDQLCEVGALKINEAMGYNQVSVYEHGKIITAPSNKMSVLNYIVVVMVAAFGACAVLVVIYILDDTLKSNEDCEKYLGLTVLGDIPNAYENHKNKRGYYYYSGKKSYGSRNLSSEVNKDE